LTELEVCNFLGIHPLAWNLVIRGVRRPSNKFIVKVGEILGDEAQLLFLGYYIDNNKPEFVLSNEYDPDFLMKLANEKIKKILNKGGKLRYE